MRLLLGQVGLLDTGQIGALLMSELLSFESAIPAIKRAHKLSEGWRRMAQRDTPQHPNSPPVHIWRRSTKKRDRTAAHYIYTLGSGWEETPDGVGALVMSVSASGREGLHGPWLDHEELSEAIRE